MGKTKSVVSLVILALLAGPVLSETARDTSDVVAPKPMRTTDWSRELDLQYWEPGTFYQDVNLSIDALARAHGREKAEVFMDAAELYMSHMLVDEAASILEGVKPTTPWQDRRYRSLRDAVSLLSGNAVEDFETSSLNQTSRPDRAFWASLQGIASADVGLLNANILDSFGGMALQSRAVLRQLLPVFTEAAMELGHAEYASAALDVLEDLPETPGSSVKPFLRARAQELRGNESTALETYLLAAEGWDEYAVRARIAVADMALRDGGQGALLAAQSLLSGGAEAWRGDQFELELLKRLSRIYQGTESEAEELLTLGKILARFPFTSEAELAQEQALSLMSTVYGKGLEGAYPLTEWVEMHLRLLPFFRGYPEFATNTVRLGDYLLSLGSTDMAAWEYRRAIRLIEARTTPLTEPQQTELTAIYLKLAEAQEHGGLYAEALQTLDNMEKPKTPENIRAFDALRATVLAGLEDRQGLMSANIADPTAQHLRDLGLALIQEESWPRAREVYERLWQEYPGDFYLEDATHLLIAANRTDDDTTITRVARAFPELTRSKSLIDLAESLTEGPSELLPLRAEQAAKRLQSLDDAFTAIRNTTDGE